MLLYRYVQNEAVTSETIAVAAANPSLAVDEDGYLHVVYFETATFHLMYADNVSGSWQAQTVDADLLPSYFRGRPSLAVDVDGNAHISYVKDQQVEAEGDELLRYATNKSGTWAIVDIETLNPYCVESNSTAVDALGNAHLSYCAPRAEFGNYPTLIYAKIVGNTPTTTALVHGEPYARHTQIASTNGEIAIALTVDNGRVMFAQSTNDEWEYSSPFLFLAPKTMDDFSLALDDDGAIHLCATMAANSQTLPQTVRYLTNASGQWAATQIATGNETLRFPSISLDQNNVPQIAFFRQETGQLMAGGNVSGQWQTAQIDRKMNLDEATLEFTFGASGEAHLLFQSENQNALIYAVSTTGGWQARQIATNIHDVRLFVDAQSAAHVIALTDQDNDLVYITNSSGKWVTRFLVEGCDESTADIVVAGNGLVHIFYSLGDKPMHMTVNGTFFRSEEIPYDGALWSSQKMDAQIDETDGLHLVIDHSFGTSYFRKLNGTWVQSSIGGAGNYEQTSLRLDSKKAVHLLADMKYITNETSQWTLSLRSDSLTDFLLDGVDLFVGGQGRAWIANANADAQAIEIYYQKDSQWQQVTVPRNGLVEGSVRLLFNADRRPNLVHIGDDAIWFNVY